MNIKIGDKVVIHSQRLKAVVESFYDDDRAIVKTDGGHEYLIAIKDLRIIKDKTFSTWR